MLWLLCFAVRVFSLTGNHSPPYLPKMPSNTVLMSGPAVGTAQILSCSIPMCSCLQCSQLSELVHFPLWELSVTFCIFHRHRVCLVDPVDLICISWWEGFGSSSLATLPLGFNCGFIPTSACGSSTGVCSWGCPGGVGLPCEGQVWRWCSCLGHWGSGSTRYSGELVARAAGNRVL